MNIDKTASSYSNPLWKSFYIPNDNITTRFKNVLKKYENLPANFYYDKNIKESYGLPLLEPKKTDYTIKEKPLLSKLKNKEYETDKSKSDYKIVKDIQFFINNLPSFKQYKNIDDLTFLIKNHRLLILEILEYYANKDTSIKTIEGRIVALLRVLYIAFKEKSSSLYQKYSILMLDLLFQHKQDEDEQQLNKNEQERFIPFEIVIDFQKRLAEQYITNPTYKNNQDLVFISLYRYLPQRDELKQLEYTTTSKTDKDYIYIDKDDDVFLLLNKPKKKHKELYINLSKDFKELAEILKDSYNKFKRTYVLTDYNDIQKPISIQGLYKRMINLFSFTNKRVGVSILRSSYLTYQSEQKRLSVADKKKLATLMRTRKDKIDEAYIKILPKQDKQEIMKEIDIPTIKETKAEGTYKKQLLNNKSYYEKNKKEIIARVKQNQAKIPKEQIARKRLLYYLNGDESYSKRIKPETIKKYNIRYEKIGGIDKWV